MYGRRILLVLVLPILFACGGDNPAGPESNPPSIPDIVGAYSGTWTISLIVPSTGEQEQTVCPGGVTVTNEGADGSFTGTWTWGASSVCSANSGALGGSVQAGGALTVSQFSSNAGEQSLEELTDGQCSWVSGVGAFAGTANRSIFEMSGTAIAQCLGIQINVAWTLSTSRASGQMIAPSHQENKSQTLVRLIGILPPS